MTFYYPKLLYDGSARWHIFPLLKSLMKEENNSFQNLSITEHLEQADCIIIPMSWNYYHTHKKVNEVLRFCSSLPNNLKIISFVFGDYGVKVPKSYKGFIFRSNGQRSKHNSKHIGLPVFIEDPISKYFSIDDVIPRTINDKAVVGFCGQAMKLGMSTLKEVIKTGIMNFLSILGYSNRDKDQFMSTTYFRWKILNDIQNSDKIYTNIILRKAYRAGVLSQKDKHPTTMQFYNNIKDSDYVVCMRGAGNFSTRFYETLAMGRIPVFVNTDCILPLANKINWKQHIVWVEYNERHLIVKKVVDFHKKLNSASLNKLFLSNRKIWKDQLQLYPFFSTFLNDN